MQKANKEKLKEAIDTYVYRLNRTELQQHLRSELFHSLYWGSNKEDQWEFINKMERVK